MKIVIYSSMSVIPPNYGGAVRVYNLAKKLSERDIDVTLISPDSEMKSNQKDEFEYVFFTPTISKLSKIIVINKLKHFINFVLIFNEFFILKKVICEKLKRDKDIILQSEYLHSIFPLYILSNLYDLPLLISEHNVECETFRQINGSNDRYVYRLLYIMLKYIEIFFLKKCDEIICVSEGDKNVFIQKYGIPTDKITVAPNATNIPEIAMEWKSKVEFKRKLEINFDTFIVLFVGTLEYYPNLHAVEIIQNEICSRVKMKISNVKFLIVGKGVEPRIEKDIIFTGLVTDVSPYIHISDVAIAPLTEGGGTRLKILEYMAFSKPVVSTSKGSEGLDITNNENIIISDNWDDFSNEIISLLLNESRRSHIGKEAKKLIEKKYTWDSTCDKYVEVYNKIEFHSITPP